MKERDFDLILYKSFAFLLPFLFLLQDKDLFQILSWRMWISYQQITLRVFFIFYIVFSYNVCYSLRNNQATFYSIC